MEIERRKQRLLIESEIHRRSLAAGAEDLAPYAARAEQGYACARAAMPYWKVASPVLAFLIARRRKKSKKGMVAKAAIGIHLAAKALRFWKAFRSEHS